jgi:membrane-associated PAP2 superfamily phosphatase
MSPDAALLCQRAPLPLWRRHPDLAITLAGLLLLLAWDAIGWDLAVVGLFGDAGGFAWRDAFATSQLLHGGGRVLAWALLGALAWATWRARPGAGPGQSERWRWLGVVLLCVLAVPLLKQFSHTSCPWDLVQFHGVARYVPHWQWGIGDGGPGHCFPSGHAVAAFGFFGLYFLWRDHDARRARRWLLAVLVMGLVYGIGQLIRGAHYPSHTLWTAWLCWVICASAAWWMRDRTTTGS